MLRVTDQIANPRQPPLPSASGNRACLGYIDIYKFSAKLEEQNNYLQLLSFVTCIYFLLPKCKVNVKSSSDHAVRAQTQQSDIQVLQQMSEQFSAIPAQLG